MEVSYIDKLHLLTNLKLNGINDAKVECIAKSYEKMKLYILDDITELVDVLKDAKELKSTFPVYIIKDDQQLNYVKAWSDMHKPNSKVATYAILHVIHRSYLTYAFYYNKGIKQYILKNKTLITSLIRIVLSSIIASLRSAYIALSKDDLQQVKILVACFVVHCLLGIKDKSALLSLLKIVGVGSLQSLTTLFIYGKLVQYLEQQPSLIHVLANLLKWNKMAANALALQVTKLLGNTLSFILLTCDTHKLADSDAILAYKFASLYYFYSIGIIYQECNISKLNRLTDHAANALFKELTTVSKLAHFGKC